MKYFIPFLVFSFLLGCRSVQHNTPSQRPEIEIDGLVAKSVYGELSNIMINEGYSLKNANDYLITYEKPIQSIMGQALMGSRYDSVPFYRITAQIIELNDYTRVVLNFNIVTNPGSSFERLTPVNNAEGTTRFQSHLNRIKLRIESRLGYN
jgi:hypothetical protein